MQILKIFSNKRFLFVFLLGFSSGLPIALTRGTLQAWLSDSGVDLKTIGIFALVGYPYTFKFVWSPLMVRFAPSFLGLRRSWILITQVSLIALLFAMSFFQPANNIQAIALICVLIAFFGASQDIMIDGYRAEVLEKDELGTGAGLAITGYRIAMIVSGAAALILADHFSWPAVYRIMAGVMFACVIANILAPEPTAPIKTPPTLKAAVLDPLLEYFKRPYALEILGFIVLYKIGSVMAMALQTKFLLGLGFTKSDIGYVAKGLGLVATILGSIVGGMVVDKIGMKKGLIYLGIFQGASILSFSWLYQVGLNYPVMAFSMGFENFCSGLANAGYIAYLMRLCNKQHSTTQYALLSSLAAIPVIFSAASTGYIVDYIGWSNFFIFCALIDIPSLILIWFRYNKW